MHGSHWLGFVGPGVVPAAALAAQTPATLLDTAQRERLFGRRIRRAIRTRALLGGGLARRMSSGLARRGADVQSAPAGCGAGYYCRDNPVRRDQMAVFLLKAEHGSDYVPPGCTGIFPDVACPGPFADWIQQIWAEGITGGCWGGNYCPGNPVTRGQMSALLLKTKHGSSYTPPSCAGIFGDVACPGLFADWIEELYGEGITGGCSASPLLFCPASPVSRGQMAAFLVKTFGLQLYGP